MSDSQESYERTYAQHREAHGPHGSHDDPTPEQGAPSTRKEVVPEVKPSSPTPAARSLPGEVQALPWKRTRIGPGAELDGAIPGPLYAVHTSRYISTQGRGACAEEASLVGEDADRYDKLAALGARVDAVLSKMDPLPRLNAEESLRGEHIFPVTNALGEIIVAWRETLALNALPSELAEGCEPPNPWGIVP